MTHDRALELRFHAAMSKIYESAKREAGYNATRFLQMVANEGGVETARRLLQGSEVSDGFTALWAAKRLDLTVEAHVLLPSFEQLFTEEERAVARRRLDAHGWTPGDRP